MTTISILHTPRCKCGLWRAKGQRLCASGVSYRCKSPATISNRIRDGRAMASGVSRSTTAAGPLGGQKRKGETPTGVWYCFDGESPKPTGLRDSQAVLQLHPALDLLHHEPVRASVQMPLSLPAVHWVLLMG